MEEGKKERMSLMRPPSLRPRPAPPNLRSKDGDPAHFLIGPEGAWDSAEGSSHHHLVPPVAIHVAGGEGETGHLPEARGGSFLKLRFEVHGFVEADDL